MQLVEPFLYHYQHRATWLYNECSERTLLVAHRPCKA